MDELSTLATFVDSFLNTEDEAVVAASKWLIDLMHVLANMDSDITNHCFDGLVTIDDLSGLDEVLSCIPSVADTKEELDSCFPWNMLDFWMGELRRRGYELLDIAIQSVDVVEAERISEAVKAMRYPIR